MQVRVEALQFHRGARRVLDIPALTFRQGTTTALFGPNGSGKTSLLRIIAGLERPTTGTVWLGTAPASSDRRLLAYAFQEAVFVRGTVRENLALGLGLRRVDPGDAQARVAQVAEECGVTGLLDRSARAVSSGEAQRVNLARTLALRAPVTLLDEPLAGLDRVGRARLLDDLPHLLRTFATTTILVTHDREEAFRLAEDLVVLIDGTLRAAGPKGDVYRRPADRETADLLGYTVVPADGRLIAVPPGGLRIGEGAERWVMTVEGVVDMGNHLDVLGVIAQTRISVKLADGASPPERGARVPVMTTRGVDLPSRE